MSNVINHNIESQKVCASEPFNIYMLAKHLHPCLKALVECLAYLFVDGCFSYQTVQDQRLGESVMKKTVVIRIDYTFW